MSLLLMELLSSLTPPPFEVLETHFSRLGGGGGGRRGGRTRSLPPKRHVLVASGRCRAWWVSGAGRGELSPDRWLPAHLFISEAGLDWISRCLSPLEEQ